MYPLTSFKYNSSLTFNDLTRDLAFIKIIYNHKVIFDDTTKEGETKETFDSLQELYGDKIIYKMKIKIVEFHHCILHIKGEK